MIAKVPACVKGFVCPWQVFYQAGPASHFPTSLLTPRTMIKELLALHTARRVKSKTMVALSLESLALRQLIPTNTIRLGAPGFVKGVESASVAPAQPVSAAVQQSQAAKTKRRGKSSGA